MKVIDILEVEDHALVNEDIFTDALIAAASGAIIAKAIGPWLDKLDRKINNLEFMKRRRRRKWVRWEIENIEKDIAKMEKRVSKLKTDRQKPYYEHLLRKRREQIAQLAAEIGD